MNGIYLYFVNEHLYSGRYWDFKLFQIETVCRPQFLDLMKTAEISLNGFENTVGKGEIARYEEFLLYQQCFQKDCFPGPSKGVIVREGVKE